MKSVSVRDAKNGLSGCLRKSQRESVVIMKHGHPVAVLVGVEGMDLEDVYWGLNKDLMKQVLKSRAQDGVVSHEDVVQRYTVDKKRRKAAA